MDAPGIILHWRGFWHSFLFKSLISLPHGNSSGQKDEKPEPDVRKCKFWVLSIICNKNLHSKKAFSFRQVLIGLLFCTRSGWRGKENLRDEAPDDLGITEELLWWPRVHNFLWALQVMRRKSLWTVQIWALYSWLKETEKLLPFKSLKIRVLALWDWRIYAIVFSPLSWPMTCGKIIKWLFGDSLGLQFYKCWLWNRRISILHWGGESRPWDYLQIEHGVILDALCFSQKVDTRQPG